MVPETVRRPTALALVSVNGSRRVLGQQTDRTTVGVVTVVAKRPSNKTDKKYANYCIAYNLFDYNYN